MTGEELIALAKRRKENPYYLAYALATGAASPAQAFRRDGNSNHLYQSWNEDRWEEQAKAEGIGRNWVSLGEGAHERHCAICAAHIKEGAP